jgi:hypothetical protein
MGVVHAAADGPDRRRLELDTPAVNEISRSRDLL